MIGAAPLSAELTKDFMKVLPGCAIGQGYGKSHYEIAIHISDTPATHRIIRHDGVSHYSFGYAGFPDIGTSG
jgi:hypothetical protein